MGNFRLEFEAVGGHGCMREKKDGEEVEGCGQPSCPDCQIRSFVTTMKATNNVVEAKLRHWPGTATEVVDDLLTKLRKGSF